MTWIEYLRYTWSRRRPIHANGFRELAYLCDQHWRRVALTVNGTTMTGRARTTIEPCPSGFHHVHRAVDLHLDDPYQALALNDHRGGPQ